MLLLYIVVHSLLLGELRRSAQTRVGCVLGQPQSFKKRLIKLGGIKAWLVSELDLGFAACPLSALWTSGGLWILRT
jgi:hypothetical protein